MTAKVKNILDMLDKHFHTSWASFGPNVVEFKCQLSGNVSDGVLSFPFSSESINEYKPKEIVNAIFTFISIYML